MTRIYYDCYDFGIDNEMRVIYNYRSGLQIQTSQ